MEIGWGCGLAEGLMLPDCKERRRREKAGLRKRQWAVPPFGMLAWQIYHCWSMSPLLRRHNRRWLCLSHLGGIPTEVPSSGRRSCSMETLRPGGRSSDRLNLMSGNYSGDSSSWYSSKNPHMCPTMAQNLDPAMWRGDQPLAVGQRSSRRHREKLTEGRLLPHSIIREGTPPFSCSSSPPNSRGGRR